MVWGMDGYSVIPLSYHSSSSAGCVSTFMPTQAHVYVYICMQK